ncbi:hypothetical protein Bcav_0721 [Beutenbergia cavernae DSM 12333]|uniref:Uncharacterized protein n=1 Tax=Beutenbergia cavernae (strain ATCC BAA-8 / DSM 12333 / CCUG 43141 / JCM 11478 / NBRC 16432 / NCIMB 13614 / HKI 0122) TaxID=471853 RepID=C5BYM4_BEUC1|nr:hypothetical protein [Beutenbergia cavernae]ACQ78982.1 hypothetical protein Bcav_0721 [Beutenbergia cavernae DSM 12333]
MEIVGALLPPIGLALLFTVVIRALVLADRRERVARQREDAEIARSERAARRAPDDEHA